MISNLATPVQRAARAASRAAHGPTAVVVFAAICAAATASFGVPVGPFLTAFSAAAPARWWVFAVTASLTTAATAVAINLALVAWATPWIAAHVPAWVASPEWHRLTAWMHAWGMLAMIAWLALPLPQSPLMVLNAMAGTPLASIAVAFIVGKGLKYAVTAYVASRVARLGARALPPR